MRKKDYETLAHVIAMHLLSLYPLQNGGDPASKHVIEIARVFADRASVDKAAFLKACGIDP